MLTCGYLNIHTHTHTRTHTHTHKYTLTPSLLGRGLNPTDYERAASTVKADFGAAIRYANEAGHVFLWENYTSTAPSLSHVSVDIYHFQELIPGPKGSGWCTPTPSTPEWDAVISPLTTCVDQVRIFYEKLYVFLGDYILDINKQTNKHTEYYTPVHVHVSVYHCA